MRDLQADRDVWEVVCAQALSYFIRFACKTISASTLLVRVDGSSLFSSSDLSDLDSERLLKG